MKARILSIGFTVLAVGMPLAMQSPATVRVSPAVAVVSTITTQAPIPVQTPSTVESTTTTEKVTKASPVPATPPSVKHPSSSVPELVTTTTEFIDDSPAHFIDHYGYCGTTSVYTAKLNGFRIIDDAACVAAIGTPPVADDPQ